MNGCQSVLKMRRGQIESNLTLDDQLLQANDLWPSQILDRLAGGTGQKMANEQHHLHMINISSSACAQYIGLKAYYAFRKELRQWPQGDSKVKRSIFISVSQYHSLWPSSYIHICHSIIL